jgi:ribosomal protein S18 acetylase RimI-like enzyme
MGDTAILEGSLAARARDWRNAMHAAVCDVIEPWAHGTLARAGRYPTYYDFNVLRVEDDVALDVPLLEVAADEALRGLEHRRVDFDILERGAQRRGDFEAAGWKTTRLVWMLHAGVLAGEAPDFLVEEVDYEETEPLRLSWHLEERADLEYEQYRLAAKEVAMAKDPIVLIVRDPTGEPIAFTQLQRDGGSAEINSVYVRPDHRGRGLGTAITRAAIAAGGEAEDLWIVADDEGRAKDLYARLGFRTVWTTIEFLRLR